ncbi:MAG: hypothetical protein JWN48_4997 [Myxococcaceae bacterium]|nr:hypothetical protein [Myxococcaceae bacterium]
MSFARTGWPLSVLALLAVLLSVAPGAAQAPTRAGLTCGVEGATRGVRRADLCTALGQALKRTVTQVEDARDSSGDAVQIIGGDVQWIVIWLSTGRVRAWTRVSQTEAADDQLRFVVRATEALIKASSPAQQDCVRLDPNGGRKMRSTDLTYPWAELRPCKRRQVEVVDPWWLPG